MFHKSIKSKMVRRFFIVFVLVCGLQPHSYAQENEVRNLDVETQKHLMKEAVLEKLTIWTIPSNNKPIYVRHCRNLKHGCRAQISAFVEYIFDVSIPENFDPWLLAGIAWHESSFNPYAESHAGAVGILQLLRRSRWSQGLPFVRKHWYRKQCRRKLGSCQRSIVERSVYWLKRSFRYCGTVSEGLRLYNSGRCDGPKKYPRVVSIAKRDILKRAMKFYNAEKMKYN